MSKITNYTINNQRAPSYYEANGGGGGIVIFIHGFMGSPRQFDGLVETARQHGRSAAALLLPGHGGTVKYFSTGTMELWQNHVNSEIERYSQNHKDIWLVGHSMGCLLALGAAAKYPDRIRGALLIASAMKLKRFYLKDIRVRLLPVFGSKSNPIRKAYSSVCGIDPTLDFLWRYRKPLSELKKLMAATREILPKIKAPVTAISMSSDEIISLESLSILESGLSGTTLKQIVLTDSYHAYFPEHESSIITQELVELIR